MSYKKTLIGTVGGTILGATLGGKRALGLGIKIGLATAVTAGALGSTLFVVGKKKITKKLS